MSDIEAPDSSNVVTPYQGVAIKKTSGMLPDMDAAKRLRELADKATPGPGRLPDRDRHRKGVSTVTGDRLTAIEQRARFYPEALPYEVLQSLVEIARIAENAEDYLPEQPHKAKRLLRAALARLGEQN